MTSRAATDLSRALSELLEELLLPVDPLESPAAILPRIQTDCSYTSLLELESKEIRVGMASACRRRRCCEDADNCCGNDVEPIPWRSTGVGGGKKEFIDGFPLCDEGTKGGLPFVDKEEDIACEDSIDPVSVVSFSLDC
jgi:hypothetical protein